MAIEFNVGNKADINVQTSPTSTSIGNSGPQTSSKILDGKSLTVSSGAMTDLEKLVARIKSENEGTRESLAHQRIAILQTVMDSMADRVTEAQKKAVLEIEDLADQKTKATAELSSLTSEKTATAERIAALDIEIQALENAVKQAIQDGADHREQVEKLKNQRAEEQKKLDRLEGAIASTSSKIAGIDVKIATCTKEIGAAVLNEVANALRMAENEPSQTVERDEKNADREKEERKEAATDIAASISRSLDRIDEQIRRTLDEANVVKA